MLATPSFRSAVRHALRPAASARRRLLSLSMPNVSLRGTVRRVLFWDCDVAEPVLGLSVPSRVQISCAAVSPRGTFLALCGDYVVLVLELINTAPGAPAQQPRPVAQGYGHSNEVVALQWSPDERQIVSVGKDCCVSVWNFYGAMGGADGAHK